MHKLSKIVNKKFTYQDVLDIYPELSYEQLYDVIQSWLDQELVTPVKKSGMTSFRPQVYHQYIKKAVKPDYNMYTERIQSLHPRLNISRYLAHPEAYVKEQEYIDMLSDFLWNNEQHMDEPMSVNEKSYEIWSDEKFLGSGRGRKLLSYQGLSQKDFGCYKTPEPYFMEIYADDFTGKAVLVIENKDTWYTIAKLLKERDEKMICDIPFAMLVFGEGNKATRKQGMTDFLMEYTSLETAVYYFGDIDAAGLDIYDRMTEANPQLHIQRFMPGYQAMIRKAAGRTLRPTEDTRKLKFPQLFLEGFRKEEQQVIRRVLKEGRRIPQEILNYQDYQLLCR